MKALQLIFRYFKYFFTAKSKHAAQAPFLYELIMQVIDKRTNDTTCQSIETLRKELCKSEKEIQITDFGAGSTINNSKTRKVKDVAKNSAKNAKFGKLLYRIIQFYKPKNIIELGKSAKKLHHIFFKIVHIRSKNNSFHARTSTLVRIAVLAKKTLDGVL